MDVRASCRALELVQRTTHGGYTGASADNLMAVTFSGYMIFAFIYLSQQWDTVLPMTRSTFACFVSVQRLYG